MATFKSKEKGDKEKMVKLCMIEVGNDYKVRKNDGVIVGPTVQKEVLILRKPTHHPT